jgi:hypothetical protein
MKLAGSIPFILEAKLLWSMTVEGYGLLNGSVYSVITGGLMVFGQKSIYLFGNLPWSSLDVLGNSLRSWPLEALHLQLPHGCQIRDPKLVLIKC